jgi:hypothetical protein
MVYISTKGARHKPKNREYQAMKKNVEPDIIDRARANAAMAEALGNSKAANFAAFMATFHPEEKITLAKARELTSGK